MMKQITAHELTAMSEQAASVARLRAHRTLHEELSDPVQRLAIAMEPGTYIRPHRHPQTWELLTCCAAALWCCSSTMTAL